MPSFTRHPPLCAFCRIVWDRAWWERDRIEQRIHALERWRDLGILRDHEREELTALYAREDALNATIRSYADAPLRTVTDECEVDECDAHHARQEYREADQD